MVGPRVLVDAGSRISLECEWPSRLSDPAGAEQSKQRDRRTVSTVRRRPGSVPEGVLMKQFPSGKHAAFPIVEAENYGHAVGEVGRGHYPVVRHRATRTFQTSFFLQSLATLSLKRSRERQPTSRPRSRYQHEPLVSRRR